MSGDKTIDPYREHKQDTWTQEDIDHATMRDLDAILKNNNLSEDIYKITKVVASIVKVNIKLRKTNMLLEHRLASSEKEIKQLWDKKENKQTYYPFGPM